MVAVGLRGMFLGPRAVWTLPVLFTVVMAAGGVLGILGIPLPAVETGITLSALELGLAVVFAARPALWIAALIVGLFAIFHGYAYGLELPHATSAMPYSVGFVISTGLLHLAGIAFASLERWRWGEVAVHPGGAAIATCGVWFMVA